MKRVLTLLMLVALLVGMTPSAMAAEIAPLNKATDRESERITAYTNYLKELFDEGAKGKISHVGIADVNKDYRPELFYVWRKSSGLSEFHVCYYESGEVIEYEIENDYIGVNPTQVTLERCRKGKTSEHCWVLTSTGKNEKKWSEKLWNVFDRSGTTLNNTVRFRRTWKGSSNRYYINEMQTVKAIFQEDLLKFNNLWDLAVGEAYKYRGPIYKVASRTSWPSVRKALGSAATAWLALEPVY